MSKNRGTCQAIALIHKLTYARAKQHACTMRCETQTNNQDQEAKTDMQGHSTKKSAYMVLQNRIREAGTKLPGNSTNSVIGTRKSHIWKDCAEGVLGHVNWIQIKLRSYVPISLASAPDRCERSAQTGPELRRQSRWAQRW
jgi:hypothetical protein